MPVFKHVIINVIHEVTKLYKKFKNSGWYIFCLEKEVGISLGSTLTKFNENKDLTCQITDILKGWYDGEAKILGISSGNAKICEHFDAIRDHCSCRNARLTTASGSFGHLLRC